MTTDRRWGIAVVLGAALVVVLAKQVSGSDVRGEAVALPWTPPPAIGACLTDADASGSDARWVQVPCNRPHTKEVLQSWRAGQQPSEQDDHCLSQGATWSRTSSGDWEAPQPWILDGYVHGGDPLGWVACVQGPVTSGPEMRPLTYEGSIAIMASDQPAPVVGACYRDPLQQTDCTAPHFFERIGIFLPEYLSHDPVNSCAVFARNQIGDSAFRGTAPLRVSESEDKSLAGEVIQPGDSRHRVVFLRTCDVMPAEHGRELIGSVVGLGDRPIPYG